MRYFRRAGVREARELEHQAELERQAEPEPEADASSKPERDPATGRFLPKG